MPYIVADHSLGSAFYAARAMRLASARDEAEAAVDREHRWQREHLPEEVRHLVLVALEEGTVLGAWKP